MGKLFKVNDNNCYQKNEYADRNSFIGREANMIDLPCYEDVKDRLPKPIWDGNEDAIECYNKVWKIGFSNLRKPNADAGFVSPFIDTAFNGYLFMWDSAFIMMFGRYASGVFDFQQTLDNFYSHQHKDGFICREIFEDEAGEQWTRDDPCSTGPNVLPWAEWEYYTTTGNIERLSAVFDPLVAYHKWLSLNRAWQDGTYWSCGNACGMDNLPRPLPGFDEEASHSFMSWIDATTQMYLSADILVKMARELGRESETAWLSDEAEMLKRMINEKMWDEELAFYCDKYRDGSLSRVKTVAPYWTLLAGIVPEDRAERFIAHLENENEFKRPNRVPALSADHPYYQALFGYWCGGVWAPTNYMIMRGLEKYGYHKLAREIGVTYHDYVVNVFRKEGTVFEYYSPELPYMNSGKRDFVGWGGIAPVAVLFEFVFGIRSNAKDKHITWRVGCTERHGIERYPLGSGTVDLLCEARQSADERPVITVRSNTPVTVEVIWNDETWEIKA